MTDLTPNIPEVVAEVTALFERYEQALIDKNVAVLDATFWNSPHTIRVANLEHGYGFDRIHAHREARPPGPGLKEKRIRLEILTLARKAGEGATGVLHGDHPLLIHPGLAERGIPGDCFRGAEEVRGQRYGIHAAIEQDIEEVTAQGASGPAAMGKVMGLLKAALAGKADMSAVSAKVKSRLNP